MIALATVIEDVFHLDSRREAQLQEQVEKHKETSLQLEYFAVRLDSLSDTEIWTKILQRHVLSAVATRVPVDLDIVRIAAGHCGEEGVRASVQIAPSSSVSLICILLDKRNHTSKLLEPAVQAVEILIKNGAPVEQDEINALASAWLAGQGAELELTRIGKEKPDAWNSAQLRVLQQSWPGSKETCPGELKDFWPAGSRAISVKQLQDFYRRNQVWIETERYNEHLKCRAAPTMHDVVNAIIKRDDVMKDCSFAELLPPRRPLVFVSHNWKTEFRFFYHTVLRHAKETFPDSYLNTPYWICSFANNQHDVVIPDLENSPFNRTLEQEDCERLLFVMDMDQLPLTRLWCLYELVRSQELPKKKLVDFATPDGVLNRQASLSADGKRTIQALQV
mmetsp:Transcript_27135/g.65528  ORF Transcript_27135/g.65528 Transcript_27135/m.65528 type:complete len:392 (+) Transcript_27135:1-1176(+)